MKDIWTERITVGTHTRKWYVPECWHNGYDIGGGWTEAEHIETGVDTYILTANAAYDQKREVLVLDLEVTIADYEPQVLAHERIFETQENRKAAIRSVIKHVDAWNVKAVLMVPLPDRRTDAEIKADYLREQQQPA